MKNLLTKRDSCDIMSKHFRPRGRGLKKIERNFQKPLDKVKRMCYNNKVAQKRPWGRPHTDHWQLNNRRLKYKQSLWEISKFLWKRNLESITDSRHTRKSIRAKQARETKILTGNGLNTICSRVWSWLRMNAGGVHNTFKSNGDGASAPDQWRTGE